MDINVETEQLYSYSQINNTNCVIFYKTRCVNVKRNQRVTRKRRRMVDGSSVIAVFLIHLFGFPTLYSPLHPFCGSACGSCPLPFFDVHFISSLFSCPLTSLYFPLSVPSTLVSIPVMSLSSTLFLPFSLARPLLD